MFWKYLSHDNGGSQTLNNDKEVLEESNELIVKNEKFIKYYKLKKCILIKRVAFAIFHTLFILGMTILYYADIWSDIKLCIDYFKSSKIKLNNIFNETLENSTDYHNLIPGVMTLLIIIVSTILHYYIVFKLCRTELLFKWKSRNFIKRVGVIFRIFCIILYLEMSYW